MKKILFIIVFGLFLASCKDNNSNSDNKEIVTSTNTMFSLVDSSESGLDFVNILNENDSTNVILYEYFYNGSGVSVGDINNDGLQDLFFTSNSDKSKLYLNKGDLKFEDITVSAGINTDGHCSGVTMGDVNNDGFLDIYVCRSNALNAKNLTSNLLYINQGDMTFKEMSKEYGLFAYDYSTTASFLDYDLDGDLDLFVGNHIINFAGDFMDYSAYEYGDNSSSDKLYRNDDNAGFTEVTKQAIGGTQTFTLGVAIFDINRDGYPDIFTTSDYHGPDLLHINNGDGTFTEKQKEYFKHSCYAAMGCDAADYNNDGLLDLMIVDMLPEDGYRKKTLVGPSNFDLFVLRWKHGYGKQYMKNTLQLNTGEKYFSEIADLVGVDATDWSWSPLFADFDNDGWKDLFVTNGYYRDYTDQDFMTTTVNARYNQDKKLEFEQMVQTLPIKRFENVAYKNNRDLTFKKVTTDWGLSEPGVSNGSAYADLDNDGDLDLVICNINQNAFLYENNSGGNFLQLECKGKSSNKFGIGVEATLYHPEGKQYLVNQLTRGYNSSVSPILHFGLGDNKVDSVVVVWPNKKSQTIYSPEINSRITVSESEAVLKPSSSEGVIEGQPTFVNVAEKYNADITHDESAYIDFKLEPLLPQMYSKQGPEISVGDVNNDGLEDFILAGTAISSPQLMIQGKNGVFSPKNGPWVKENNTEESVVLIFDANGDEYLDIFIGCGSNEIGKMGEEFYTDYIYINDNGVFKEQKLDVQINTADAVTMDIDSDGDLDLLLAGGVKIGKYPLAYTSKVLVNTNGTFTNKTTEFIGGLTENLLCDDIKVANLIGDEDPEIILSGDWMPITVFSKQNSKWTDITSSLELNKYSGLWNDIELVDLDGDGDLDIVAGNEGLNSQIEASFAKPLTVDYGFLDDNKSWDAIVSQYYGNNLQPIYSKNDLSDQMRNFVLTNYKYYSEYASASTSSILAKLKPSKRAEVNYLRSDVFINEAGVFKPQGLPVLAQAAPVEAIEALDVNGDGNLDLLIAGNNNNNKIEYGWVDGLNGMVLLGDGKGNFTEYKNSGFYVPGQAKNIEPITVNGKKMYLVAQNHGKVKLFEFTGNTPNP